VFEHSLTAVRPLLRDLALMDSDRRRFAFRALCRSGVVISNE
jgi:hypothetical protein